MGTELHIQLQPDLFGDFEEILADFPFEAGQTLVGSAGGLVVIDLGEQEDTNYVQDWYLNSHNDVVSFYVVED
jgi:hypothetical protein